ncbi:hypothetical protein [Massilia sp. TWR1-2-2]|uniref:hypothetical protein n=1 Tax=Massilia sp. TWR1-2-2 TaxID=2804584 RepID=UPI003CF3D68F
MTASTRKPAATPATPAIADKPAAPARRRAGAKTVETPVTPIASPTALKRKQHEKRIRTSFALPESEIILLVELKKRCLEFGMNVKKGELLTAGLQLLKYLPETALEAAVLPSMRAGRKNAPVKKRKK